MTTFTKNLHVIATNRAIGDLLFSKLNRDPGAADLPPNLRPFTGEFALLLRPAGSGGADTASGFTTPARAWMAPLVAELNGPGPYTNLLASGLTAQNIADAKTGLIVGCYDRTTGTDWVSFLAANGYEIYQQG